MVAQRYTVRRTNSSQAGGVTRYENTILVVHYDRQLRGNSCRAGIDKNTAVQWYQEDIRGLLDAANPIFRNMRCTSMTLGGQALSRRAICSSWYLMYHCL